MDRAIIEHDLKMAFDDGYQAGVEAAQPKWISVEERLPEHLQYVLTVNSQGEIEVMYYDTEWPNCFCLWDGRFKKFDVTHWLRFQNRQRRDDMTNRAKEIVEQLRAEDNCNVLDYIDEAADLIESLVADNTRLKCDLMQMKGSRDGWKLRALNAESKIERS